MGLFTQFFKHVYNDIHTCSKFKQACADDSKTTDLNRRLDMKTFKPTTKSGTCKTKPKSLAAITS